MKTNNLNWDYWGLQFHDDLIYFTVFVIALASTFAGEDQVRSLQRFNPLYEALEKVGFKSRQLEEPHPGVSGVHCTSIQI